MSGHDPEVEEKRTTVQCAVMLKQNLLTRMCWSALLSSRMKNGGLEADDK
jgi:hypothetical protein